MTFLIALPAGAPGSPDPAGQDRDPVLAEAFARLQIAAQLHHTTGAARILDQLAGTETGAWLLAQMTAAGLRALSTGIQTLPTSYRPAAELETMA